MAQKRKVLKEVLFLKESLGERKNIDRKRFPIDPDD